MPIAVTSIALLQQTAFAVIFQLDDEAHVEQLAGSTAADISVDSAYAVATGGYDRTLVLTYTAYTPSFFGNSGSLSLVPVSVSFGGKTMTAVDSNPGFFGAFGGAARYNYIFYLNESDFGADFSTSSQDVRITRSDGDFSSVVQNVEMDLTFVTLANVNQSTTIGTTQFGVAGSSNDVGNLVGTMTPTTTNSYILTSLAKGNVNSEPTLTNGASVISSSANLNLDTTIAYSTGEENTAEYGFVTNENAIGLTPAVYRAVEFLPSIPESQTYALIAGVIALCSSLTRRRRIN